MGSDEWETEAYKEGQKKEQERVRKLNEETEAKLKDYFVQVLKKHGCPDKYLNRTSNTLTRNTIKILGWKGEEVSSFYR